MKSGRGLSNVMDNHFHADPQSPVQEYQETSLPIHINGDSSRNFPQMLDEGTDSMISDNMSHLSMEVNTTGTGSVMEGDDDSDDGQAIVQDDAFDNLI
ncbi:hypothetical protein BGZ50_005719 [Haplosporangium sp. Z 11]|nr:hypothetical protein BGZ50_005719 [Haplosporangium sp. Z 11]